MIFSKVIATILTLNLLFLESSLCFAKSPQVKDNREDILNALMDGHDQLAFNGFQDDVISKSGNYLLTETNNFLKNSANQDLVKSEKGKLLLERHKKLSTYIALKKYLDNCVKNEASAKNYKDKILSSAFNDLKNQKNVSPCQTANATSQLEKLSKDLKDISHYTDSELFIQQLTQKNLTNSAKALFNLKYKFDPEFFVNSNLSSKEVDDIFSSVCFKRACEKLTPNIRSEIEKELRDFSKNIATKDKRFNLNTATQSLNSALENLNQNLSRIEVKKDKGIIFDDPKLNDPIAKKNYDDYVLNYFKQVQSDAGILLLTETLKNKSGDLKTFNDSDLEKNSKGYYFQKYSPVTTEQVKKAIAEAKGKIIDNGIAQEKIIQREIQRKSVPPRNAFEARKKDIQELISTSPAVAGTVLMQTPNQVKTVCESINQISQDIENGKKIDRFITVGSAVLGGALLLTGVGTMAGGYLITGSLSAGVASGTIGGTILATTVTAAATVELSSAIYHGAKSVQTSGEISNLERTIFSGNDDSSSISERKNAYVEMKEHQIRAAVSLASAGMSFIRIEKILEIGFFAKDANKLQNLKINSKILEALSDSIVAKKIADSSKLILNRPKEVIEDFFQTLTLTSESVRIKFLELLKNSKITPEKLKEIFETSLNAAKSCVKS